MNSQQAHYTAVGLALQHHVPVYYPNFAEFESEAQHANLLPVFREIMADGETPVSVYSKLGGKESSFLLESVVGGGKWAAYSFIGVGARAQLSVRGTRATLKWLPVDGEESPSDEEFHVDDCTAAIECVLARFTSGKAEHLPRFWGGAVGWISYDAVRGFESLPTKAVDELTLPELCVVITDTVVIVDNLRQTIKVVATPMIRDTHGAGRAYEAACSRIDAIVEILRQPGHVLPPLPLRTVGEVGSNALRFGGCPEPTSTFSEEAFLAAVARIQEYIRSGDIFQVVLSRRLQLPCGDINLFDVYRSLRVVNPSPYMFHLRFGDVEVTGASPETQVRCEQGQMVVRPIAGTRPRGTCAREDDVLARELLADEKECAEHRMLIDLGRNDVGRVCEIGSVGLSERMVVERYSHVMHMVSNVEGRLRGDVTWRDALKAAFPAGTLSGAPKIRAMEIIEELEPVRRGLYGGAVGYVSFTGNLDTAIAIRTVVRKGKSMYVQSGGGIVHDSDPRMEFEETLNKARGVLRAIALAGGEIPCSS